MGLFARAGQWFADRLARRAQPIGQDRRLMPLSSAPIFPGGPAARPIPVSQWRTRLIWNPGDDVVAMAAADGGSLLQVAQMVEGMLGDGVISGIVDSLAAGLIALPFSIEGQEGLVQQLAGNPEVDGDGDFWRMHPKEILGRAVMWGILAGGGFGEYVQCPKTGLPVLHNIELQHVNWRRNAQTRMQELYIIAEDGEHIIEPGNGRFFAFTPWGIQRFWLHGKWRPCGKAWLDKVQAQEQRTVAGARHSLGITWLKTPAGKSRDEDATAIVNHITSSPVPPVLALEDGYSIEHEDIAGEGYQQWTNTKEESDLDVAIALTGQTVTSGQGSSGGWSRGDIHENVANMLIQRYAGAMSKSVQEHGLEPYAECEGAPGINAQWDPTPPKNRKEIGEALGACGDGIAKADASLKSRGKRIKVDALFERAGFDLEDINPPEAPSTVIDGLPVVFEYPPGSMRSGTDERGVPWAVSMGSVGYGYIPGTQGRDGEPLDIYVGPARGAKTLFVMHQLTSNGTADELKLFAGFATLDDAQREWMRLVARPELVGAWKVVDLATVVDILRAAPPVNLQEDGVEVAQPNKANPPPAPIDSMQAKAAAAVVEQPVQPSDDKLTKAEAIRLAEEMTAAGFDRCEHNRVNECDWCDIERVRGVMYDAKGKPIGWKKAWKARGVSATAAVDQSVAKTNPASGEATNV